MTRPKINMSLLTSSTSRVPKDFCDNAAQLRNTEPFIALLKILSSPLLSGRKYDGCDVDNAQAIDIDVSALHRLD